MDARILHRLHQALRSLLIHILVQIWRHHHIPASVMARVALGIQGVRPPMFPASRLLRHRHLLILQSPTSPLRPAIHIFSLNFRPGNPPRRHLSHQRQLSQNQMSTTSFVCIHFSALRAASPQTTSNEKMSSASEWRASSSCCSASMCRLSLSGLKGYRRLRTSRWTLMSGLCQKGRSSLGTCPESDALPLHSKEVWPLDVEGDGDPKCRALSPKPQLQLRLRPPRTCHLIRSRS